MKLWQKKGSKASEVVDTLIHHYTIQNDPLLDLRLLPYDALASMAHAKMLVKIGLLKPGEGKALVSELQSIYELSLEGKFPIAASDEDCHTAIENHLTKKLGEVGKKIHSARSRNDQVLTAIRLFEKAMLEKMEQESRHLQKALTALIKKHGKTTLPGYTHMRQAMPMSVSMWLSQYADALKDHLKLLAAVRTLCDQSPLGTAAGFGVPAILKIDRKMTAKALGFKRVQKNPLYAQLSRGLFEGSISHFCASLMLILNRLASDLILFSMKEFSFISLPAKFCTGSSIMPQKLNPDVLELVRANYHVVLAEEFKIMGITSNLISGYNRDLQLTKAPLFNAIEVTLSSLAVTAHVIKGITINTQKCIEAVRSSEELYATHEAYRLVVEEGVPFRDAYRMIANKYK
ncbi:MAG: argininosuccinate lyase [Oligoflexia bacterium]|nr:argininosuccinate lyase [Oligoflexia bacterium]MBF0366394.1 argininosuccinate lyase [Oligoflexia bacterium]